MNGEYESKFNDCKLELEKIKQWINNNKLDTNVKFLVSYSVIRACGTIEFVFKQIIFNYLLDDNTKEDTVNYLNIQIIDSSCNPGTGNIERMLELINTSKKQAFSERIKGTNEKGDLKSLVNLRNDFAHGRDITSSINDVIKYYLSSCIVLQWLIEVLS